MPSLLDSDVVIRYLPDDTTAVALVESLARDGLAVALITYAEVYQGTLRSPNPAAAQAKLAAFLDGAPILPFTESVARHYASLREALLRQGKRVRARALDLTIAATALEYGYRLVTFNLADYDDIPDLRLYEPDDPR
jgi:tRNA(fMet)-specific endonuclease VapC